MTRTTTHLATLALLGSTLVGCGGGVEGTYTLDKAEMKKAMEADIAKMPPDQQGFAKLGLALVEAMDMKIDLKSGGKLEMSSTMPSLTKGDKPKTEAKTGEWRKQGDTVVLKADKEDKELSCKAADKKLTCEAAGKKGEPSLVFIRS